MGAWTSASISARSLLASQVGSNRFMPVLAGLALISLTILSGCQRNRGAYDPFIRADCLPAISLVDQDGHQIRVSSQPENLAGLARISRDLIAKAEVIDSAHRVVLDMDSNAPGKAWERRRG